MADYASLLEQYFDLKTKYDDEYRRKKASILNKKDLTKKQKRRLVENVTVKCIGCKKQVGTIFYDKDRIYGAMCGSKSEPCKLNIQIKKQNTMNVKTAKQDLDTEIGNNEFNIKKMKLYLLFGLINEDELIKLYEIEKDEYSSNIGFRENIENTIETNTNFTQRDEQIKQLQQDLHIAVKDIQLNMKDYIVNNNQDGLRNAMELYNETVVGLVGQLRENKYATIIIESEQEKQDELPKIIIKQQETITSDYEIIIEEPQILHFEI